MCCRDIPPVTKREMRRIKEFLRRESRSDDVFVKENYLHILDDKDNYCVLFDKTTKNCTINPVKPAVCIAYPITWDMRDGEIVWLVKQESDCPIVKYLKEHEKGLARHFEVAKRSLERFLKEIEPDELQALLQVETTNVQELNL